MLLMQPQQLHVLWVRSKQCCTCAALKRLIFHMIALRLASYFALPVLCWMSALAVCSGTCGMRIGRGLHSSLLCVARMSCRSGRHAEVPHDFHNTLSNIPVW